MSALYVIDGEGDPVCRHCRGSYNFGHFAHCKYDADYRSDRRTQEMRRQASAFVRTTADRPAARADGVQS